MYLVLLPLNKDMFLINDEGRAAEVLGINPLIFYFGSVVIYILGIIIGKKGEMLRKITKQARDDLANSLNKQVVLEVFVRVQKDWRNSPSILKMLGYEIND